jgi:hypothetical protein
VPGIGAILPAIGAKAGRIGARAGTFAVPPGTIGAIPGSCAPRWARIGAPAAKIPATGGGRGGAGLALRRLVGVALDWGRGEGGGDSEGPAPLGYSFPMEFDRDADIQLGGFSMWVDGYQFPASTEYWDANWVHVRVVCVGRQANVKFSASCVHLPELAAWLNECVRLEGGDIDRATLPTMEPYLQIKLDPPGEFKWLSRAPEFKGLFRSGEFKGLVATVKLSPDNVTQFHEFLFPVDQSCLPRLIASLRGVLGRLPIRGSR